MQETINNVERHNLPTKLHQTKKLLHNAGNHQQCGKTQFANDLANKTLIFKIYKEICKQTSIKQTTQSKHGERT